MSTGRNKPARLRPVDGNRTVTQYVTDFLARASRVVPSPSDLDQRDRFKDGLSAVMKMEMARIRPQPVDPREYMEIAEQLDQMLRAAERADRFQQHDRQRTGYPDRTRGTGFNPRVPVSRPPQLHACSGWLESVKSGERIEL
ncbi:hypothetical protein A4X09_0g7776 [Tilletia walkeri]|uniref:Uncharacterized protein n=1 Tax=Tilletia walkeri TaxID=117179 RepID=A0A8X7N0B3_9BASI|nr:hypothetical protein A4X09_0g7776 [Tilletia walkeri]